MAFIELGVTARNPEEGTSFGGKGIDVPKYVETRVDDDM